MQSVKIMNISIKKIVAILADNSKIELDTELVNTEKGIEILVIPEQDLNVKEFVLYSGKHFFAKNSHYYGDGYSMLSQYAGSLRKIKNVGAFSDKSHYKMPTKINYHTAYNYICVFDKGLYCLIGATSCNRFRTEIRTNCKNMEIVQCAENLFFMKGERIKLESFFIGTNASKKKLFDTYASMIENNHRKKNYKESPAGWCSWYCIGPGITEEKINENIASIKSKIPELKYIQIDDGYQPHMGDWLDVGDKFTRNMEDICKDIKAQGFEPAVWVAPFIASGKSKLFKEHPDYFVKDDNGLPLCSKLVTFQGWRDEPWYFIDGTNEGAFV